MTALERACLILSQDMQKVEINGDVKLVHKSAEEWKEILEQEDLWEE